MVPTLQMKKEALTFGKQQRWIQLLLDMTPLSMWILYYLAQSGKSIIFVFKKSNRVRKRKFYIYFRRNLTIYYKTNNFIKTNSVNEFPT